MTCGRAHEGRRAQVVGLLGAVASGKSTVARLLAQEGFELIDADTIGHEVLDRPEIRRALRDRFGDEVFTGQGAVDRKALGAIVFNCDTDLEELNAIVHPAIMEEVDRRIAEAGARPVVLDAALLMEKGLQRKYCDVLLFVDAPDSARRERAAARHGWNATQLSQRDAVQIPPEVKKEAADLVIDNAGGEDRLKEAVHVLTDRIREILSGLPGPACEPA